MMTFIKKIVNYCTLWFYNFLEIFLSLILWTSDVMKKDLVKITELYKIKSKRKRKEKKLPWVTSNLEDPSTNSFGLSQISIGLFHVTELWYIALPIVERSW